MIIIYTSGGLGNQMFQYAFSVPLRKISNVIKFDTTIYNYERMHNGFIIDEIFDLNIEKAQKDEIKRLAFYETNKISKIPRKLLGPKTTQIVEKGFFTQSLSGWQEINFEDNRYYQGYWQSYKYFCDYEDEIQRNFTFPKVNDKKNYNLIENIKKKNGNVCAIHIRRGDYLSSKNSFFRCISKTNYYKNAIEKLECKNENIEFYVFSDDIKWVRENMDIPKATYVDWNTGNNSYIDMQIMSNCKYIITANSTFSWWAAYLNPMKWNKIVLTPKEWFNGVMLDDIDLIPSTWEKVDF